MRKAYRKIMYHKGNLIFPVVEKYIMSEFEESQ